MPSFTKQLRKDIVGPNEACVKVTSMSDFAKTCEGKGSVFNLIKVQIHLFLQMDILVVFFSTY